MRYMTVDKLQVFITESRKEMGQFAGQDAACMLKLILQEKETVNVMFAAAPSQNDVLEELIRDTDIDWTRVNAFHLDEYIGLSADAPQGFGNFLRKKIFSRCPFRAVYYIDPVTVDPQEEALRYEQLLKENPIDICILGVGENGHMAFNDPGEADFEDPHLVRIVHLDERCRQQQVNDNCFKTIDEVPKVALTVTIPGLLRAKMILCVVPTVNKAEAIAKMLTGPVTTQCPASVLTRKQCARLYLDSEAASHLA
ncbi:glucosamine-6-phosphate deaminase [Oscillospiraceae bacterium LTW-04]|nr:glucosamine-6-phosphate deaminase [Oscillospiraceae bacterium MB24-C1]